MIRTDPNVSRTIYCLGVRFTLTIREENDLFAATKLITKFLEMQIVEVGFDHNKTVIAEAAAITYIQRMALPSKLEWVVAPRRTKA